jgi:uncharacterized RDD family membrane protein YckC
VIANLAYPRVSRRIQALMIDGLIIPISAVGVLIMAPQIGLQGIYAAILAALVVFLLEPFMVSVTGGTPGHHLLGIRVSSKSSGKDINIFAAMVRFVAKTVLGLLSIFTIYTTKQHQAIHDAIVGSIVVLKNPERMPAHEVLGERAVEQEQYIYPSKFRRIAMIVIYNIGIFLFFVFASGLLMSEHCLRSNQCSNFENVLSAGMSIFWIIGFGASIVLCWKGYLFGCRRRFKSA